MFRPITNDFPNILFYNLFACCNIKKKLSWYLKLFYVQRCISHYINYSLYYRLTLGYRIYSKLLRLPVAQLSAADIPALDLIEF